jgi:hypothetical protein
MKRLAVVLFVFVLVLTAFAGPDDAKSGFYFAPMLTSGHFGVSAHNMPEFYSQTATPTLNPATVDVSPDRGLSLGGKLGIFIRPEAHERKNRLDIEAQFEYAPGRFWFQTLEADGTNWIIGQDSWKMTNMNITARFRWSGDVSDRWQPYVHWGYSLDIIKLVDANAFSHGLNIGAGMRVRLCDHYAFYFEYETASLKTVEIAYADIDATANAALINATTRTGNVTLKPNYSMVSVAFEFPIEFCLKCEDKRSNRGGSRGW